MADYELKTQGVAGTLESSDIQIIVEKNEEKGIDIHLKSNVEKQYGRHIRKKIRETLESMGIKDAKITAVDKGALDCTIAARTMAAVHRAGGIKENYQWKEIDSWNV